MKGRKVSFIKGSGITFEEARLLQAAMQRQVRGLKQTLEDNSKNRGFSARHKERFENNLKLSEDILSDLDEALAPVEHVKHS